MNFDVVIRTVFLGEQIRVITIAVLTAEGGGDSTIAKEKHEPVDTFLVACMKIPKHVCARGICRRVFLMASIYGRKFDRISDEEGRLLDQRREKIKVYVTKPT